MSMKYGAPTSVEHVTVRISTRITYPQNGPTYIKWDYFWAPRHVLPLRFLPENFNCEEKFALGELYDFLNDGGYWMKGWQDISPEQDAWIEEHEEVHGLQQEILQEAIFS